MLSLCFWTWSMRSPAAQDSALRVLQSKRMAPVGVVFLNSLSDASMISEINLRKKLTPKPKELSHLLSQ